MNELKLLDAVKEIAYNAGEFMREGMIHTVKSKSDASNIVTDMDVKTQDFVIRELMPLIPDAKFFAEEKEIADDFKMRADKISTVIDIESVGKVLSDTVKTEN